MMEKSEGLRKKTFIGLAWSFIDRAGEQSVRFVFSVVLARLLMPEHFGLIGLAFVVIEIGRTFVQGGFGYALINKKETLKVDEDSMFYFNVFVGVAVVALINILAPYICLFFKTPELALVLRVLSLDIVIGSFGIIQTVLLTKKLNFKYQTLVSFPSSVVAGVLGILLALKGMGIWALVIQTLTRTTLYTIVIWIVQGWRPSWQMSIVSLKQLFKFGSKLMIGNMAKMVYQNINIVIIGRVFTPVQLGYYTRALQVQQLPLDTLSFIIWRVTYPVLSTIKTEQARFRNVLSKSITSIAFVVFPSLVIGSVVAENVFMLLFGEKWLPSVEFFKILCFAALFMPIENMLTNAITALGRPGIQLALQVTKYTTTIAVMLLLYRNGIRVMLVGYCVVNYVNFILCAYYTQKLSGYRLLQMAKSLAPIGFNSIVAAFLAYLVLSTGIKSMLILLPVQLLVSVVAYLSLSYLFKIDIIVELVTNLKLKLSMRREALNK